MYTALVIIDVVLALSLIALILLQQGKGADAGAAFGSGSSGTVFGAAGGASVIAKITTWLAIAFFAITLGLSVMAKDRVASAVKQSTESSIVQEKLPATSIPEQATQTSPLVPDTQKALEAAVTIPKKPVESSVPDSGPPAGKIPVE